MNAFIIILMSYTDCLYRYFIFWLNRIQCIHSTYVYKQKELVCCIRSDNMHNALHTHSNNTCMFDVVLYSTCTV